MPDKIGYEKTSNICGMGQNNFRFFLESSKETIAYSGEINGEVKICMESPISFHLLPIIHQEILKIYKEIDVSIANW